MLVDLSHVSTAVMKQALEVTQIHTLNTKFSMIQNFMK